MRQNKRYQDSGNRKQSQLSSQLNKTTLRQLESQTYSNRTLARLISTAELYALRKGYKIPQLYKKFDHFNNLERKNVDELLGELILQIQCFKVSMESYYNKFHHYDFPEDFNKNENILHLDNIRKLVKNKDKQYYKAIIKLIQGDTNIPTFDKSLENLENDDDEERDDEKTPELQLKMSIPIMRYVDSVKNNVKTKYEQNPSYKVKLDLDKPFEKNEYFDNLVKLQKDIDKQRGNYRQRNTINNQKYQYKKEEHKLEEFY